MTRDKIRNKLIEYLDTHCIDSYGELETWKVADFILKRKSSPSPRVQELEEALNKITRELKGYSDNTFGNNAYKIAEQAIKGGDDAKDSRD